jgi:hypothetical protein
VGGVVAHTCNHSAQEAEARGSKVQGHPGLHNETLSQKKKKKKKKKKNPQILKQLGTGGSRL